MLQLENWDALALTRGCFALLLFLKTLFYGLVFVQIRRQLGPKRVRMFWQHYARSQHLIAAAWRLGMFVSLFLSYVGLVLFIRIKEVSSPLRSNSPLFWLWAALLIFLLVRTGLQTFAEAVDLEASLKSLKRTLQVKAGLRHVSRAVTLLSVAYPLFAFQGWAALAVWSKRAVIMGRGAALFEKWFDRKVHGEFRQFLLASVGAAILETFLRLLLIVLALFQSRL
jgi:hypothetical protein